VEHSLGEVSLEIGERGERQQRLLGEEADRHLIFGRSGNDFHCWEGARLAEAADHFPNLLRPMTFLGELHLEVTSDLLPRTCPSMNHRRKVAIERFESWSPR
jgi:hypothetical protein